MFVLMTFVAYLIGLEIKKKTNINALLIAIILMVSYLLLFKVDVALYQSKTSYISYLLTPATISLAIPLYEQIDLLKANWKAIVIGVFTGVITSLVSITGMAILFKLNTTEIISLLPKSITTAIGMGLSEELGGLVSLTVGSIIMTGVLGAVIAPFVIKVFNIKNAIAKGVGIGSAAHAIGTSKAMEIGEIEGAMSSLSIVIAGLLTVVLAPLVISMI